LDEISRKVTIRLLIDHIDHVSILSKYARCQENRGKPWSVFIKLDMGGRRAGIPPDSPPLEVLIRAVEAAQNVDLYGFYSYSAKTAQEWTVKVAEEVLQEHISGVLKVSALVRDRKKPLTLSIGSTPTAKVISSINEQVGSNITFEIHAGMYQKSRSCREVADEYHAGTCIYNDLQQLSSGTTDSTSLAMTVIAEVCSVYSERNEALINAGVLALTREPGPIRGIARVRDSGKTEWVVDRVSQEHGILAYTGDRGQRAADVWKIGDKVELDVQHTCIVGAMYGWHFVTDGDGVVRDIYYPWKWW
jgi:D-serine deaminase-like pyridoxal phosphate-dependent protein